ncbi:MAG: NAD(P)/FAD-dependent oxidoreductase [Deltaproteobacteria bacterium]|jgi:phytoene dehydrogenase-like protein
MSEKWDVIVVGAGIGGLSAAAKLVTSGLRVLVLDKSMHPGGTAYVFTRQGFTFPMGPLGFSSPRLVRNALKGIGQDNDLEFCRVHYQIAAFGRRVPLSLPFPRLEKVMQEHFPSDKRGIRQFFGDMEKTLFAMRSADSEINHPFLQKLTTISAREHISTLVKDWRLCRILGSLGTREAYTGLPLLAAMWDLMSNEGIWYPRGGMRSFSDRLMKAVTDAGKEHGGTGEIRLGVQVKRIRVRHNRVVGVTLANDVDIDVTRVIANADYKTTFMKLIEPEALPATWRRAIANAKQSGSVYQVCLGVDISRIDLSAFSEASRLIYRQIDAATPHKEKKPDWSTQQVDPKVLACQELEVALWSKEDPRLAPEQGAVIVIRTEADYDHFTRYRPSYGQRSSAYRTYKTEFGMALVRATANLLPGLEDAIIVMDTATPLTFEEQGGRSEGAVAGWSWNYKDNPNYQPLELIRTAIRGLYMSGYQAYSALFMGGVPTAMVSGFRAAEALLEDTGPVEEVRIPGIVSNP